MAIVTLTTDLGLRDHYVASIKGQLYAQIPDVQIVDVSHEVQPFSIAEAAYFINNVLESFPEGTIHFVGVDALPEIAIDQVENNRYPTVMQIKGQFLVGCDNGFFSLVDGFTEADHIVRLDDFSSKLALRYPTKNIYIPTIARLANGDGITSLGEEVKDVRKVYITQPTIEDNLIKGAVVHTDKYGNVVVNISEKLFNEVGGGHPFTMYFRSTRYFIDRISENYNEVPTGEKLALFNESGFLEIAINKGVFGNGGGASTLLGLKTGDTIRIEFHPRGSKDNIDSLFPESIDA